MEKIKSERNLGIDLLRILSMFMVVVLHILGSGGVLEATSGSVIHNRAAWLLEIACYCAVNCYAIISGYVGYKSKYKFTNIVVLWLQVLFYTVLINGLFWIFGVQEITFESLKSAFLPVMNRDYWYFTAYFIMYLFIPILNVVLERFSKKQLGKILGLGFILLSVIPTILMIDPFHLMKGYSAGWLMYLYLLGGYADKYELFSKGKSSSYVVCYICLVLFTFLSKVGWEFITIRVFNEVRYNLMFIEYTSPTILLCGLFLVGAFSKLKVRKLAKLISFLAPLSFSVYLIHNNPSFLNEFWTNAFIFLKDLNPLLMILSVLGLAFIVYIICSIIDYLRFTLFRMFNIKGKVLRTENKYLKDVFN